MRTRRTYALSIVATLAAGAVAAACGSRGPLELGEAPAPDAGAIDAALDTAPPGPADDGAADASGNFDAGTGPLACGICLVQSCGDTILQCVASTPCRNVMQCVVQQCLTGGKGLDPSCLLSCGQSDVQGGVQAFGVVQCITSTCGAPCVSLLDGLGGLGGGGGGGGGRRDAGGPSPIPPGDFDPASATREAFSAWPELLGR